MFIQYYLKLIKSVKTMFLHTHNAFGEMDRISVLPIYNDLNVKKNSNNWGWWVGFIVVFALFIGFIVWERRKFFKANKV